MSEHLVATFARDADLLAAIRAVRQQGFRVREVFTPYVVHGVEEALDAPRSRLPWATLAGGLFGLVAASLLQFWAAEVDWPLDVGGKPPNSGLAFLPIAFEATILLGGLTTAGVFFWRSRLGPRARPRLPVAGVTDDVLALVIDLDGEPDQEPELRALLTAAGAVAVRKESP
jgi:ActD protein